MNDDHFVDAMLYSFASHDPHYNTLRSRLRRWWSSVRRTFRGWRQTAFWRVMFFLGIAWFVGDLMCKLGIYTKFELSGVCHYCGYKHGFGGPKNGARPRKIIG